MTSGMDLFVAFWAVDFDWQPGNCQDYRTRNDRLLKTVSGAGFVYAEPGKYTVLRERGGCLLV
ncbi:MAG: hypothetical protein ACREVK_05475 [Gammaproteobacteria bacterium]